MQYVQFRKSKYDRLVSHISLNERAADAYFCSAIMFVVPLVPIMYHLSGLRECTTVVCPQPFGYNGPHTRREPSEDSCYAREPTLILTPAFAPLGPVVPYMTS